MNEELIPLTFLAEMGCGGQSWGAELGKGVFRELCWHSCAVLTLVSAVLGSVCRHQPPEIVLKICGSWFLFFF